MFQPELHWCFLAQLFNLHLKQTFKVSADVHKNTYYPFVHSLQSKERKPMVLQPAKSHSLEHPHVWKRTGVSEGDNTCFQSFFNEIDLSLEIQSSGEDRFYSERAKVEAR